LRDLSSFEFSDDQFSWFRSYLSDRQSHVRVSVILPAFSINVRRDARLSSGPFVFNVFINDHCKSINHSTFLILADLEVARVNNSPRDSLLLQSDINSVSGALLTRRYLILLKRLICYTAGRKIFRITSIRFVMLPLHALTVLRYHIFTIMLIFHFQNA
jgi:hypothetical protein